MFSQAKEFLGTKALTEALGEESLVGFVLPWSCPVKEPLACTLTEE